MPKREHIKGRGAQKNVANRFERYRHYWRGDFIDHCIREQETWENNKTTYQEVFPKSIVNKVDSPDVRMRYSMNAYQGCEHGCVYCYARNTHEYWGMSPGMDFENKILVKTQAPALLEAHLLKPSWKAETIVMSGNTDCYQPAERKYKLTRKCLEVFLRWKHPVGIITKNALILRDLDLLHQLNKHGLVAVNISITSLSESTRRLLEPRTASLKKRLETIRILSREGIPVNAMLAPIIPGINSHEILPLAKAVSEAGALSFGMSVVRLNGAIGELFTDWLEKAMPEKADKVLNQIKACHSGKLNDSRFGLRNKGEGELAKYIHETARLAHQKYFVGKQFPDLNTGSFYKGQADQFRLFD